MESRQLLQQGIVELNDLSGPSTVHIFNNIDFNFRFVKVIASDEEGLQDKIGYLDDKITNLKETTSSGESEPLPIRLTISFH